MFSYLRYFSAISLVMVFIAAYAVGVYFKSIASADLIDLVSNTNTALAQSYINSTWKKYQPVLAGLTRVNRQQWNGDPNFRQFGEETLRYFEEMPIAGITIYTLSGDVIFSSQGKQDRQFGSAEEKTDFEKARDGMRASRVIQNATVIRPDGSRRGGTIIQTFVPIASDAYVPVLADDTAPKTEAVIGLQYEITAQSKKLSTFQLVTTGGIVTIFCVLIFVLILSSRRAETIIAKQHELNLELTAAAAAAEAENRDKSQFLANISHELRTPLNAIIGFSEILKTEPTLSISLQHREYLDDIHGSGKHLLSLINDILDYSKAEAGKLEVDVTEIDAIKMVKNSMRLVIPRAETAQITLVEDLPAKHVVLQTDAKKLKQVLLNLLSNAVKFTPAGGEVRVACWLGVGGDRVTFEVKDTGIGIAQKDIARVMTPFGQVDSTLARRYEGTGLGLPLSKKLVEVMGGHFEIASEVGRGTTVTLSFPRLFNREAASRASISGSLS